MARPMAFWCGGLVLAALAGCPPGNQHGADSGDGGSADAGPVNTVIPSCDYDTDCAVGVCFNGGCIEDPVPAPGCVPDMWTGVGKWWEIDTFTNLLSLQAREKAVQLVSSIDSDVPTAVKGDAGRLRQIITNIVGNAIKFTPKGTVTLHIRKDQEDANSATLRFQVNDSGIGIPVDKLEHIFEPFTQVDSSTTRKFGGTGLGLAICKRLAELMGGSIGAESTEGEGSTFWFTVVLEKMTESDHGSPQPISAPRLNVEIQATGSGTRLLLAEDDPIAQKLLLVLLSRYGYDVDAACNGKEALLALQNNDYALVLMDCMMPEISGYEATAVIRNPASAVRRHDIPVIALTGNAMKEDQARCIAAGMNDHLPKPLILGDLLLKLDYWLKAKV